MKKTLLFFICTCFTVLIKAQTITINAELPDPCLNMLSTQNTENLNSIKVYPIPSDGEIFIEFLLKGKSSIAKINIYDMAGILAYKKTINVVSKKMKEKLHLNSLYTGVYIMNVEVGEEKFSRKIIINKNK